MNGRRWEMVASSYDDCSIFPPNLHEGLHQRSYLDQTLAAQPPLDQLQKPSADTMTERCFPPREKEEEWCLAWRPLSNSAKRLMGSGLKLVRSKISARGGGRGETSGIGTWSFAALAGITVLFLYLSRRHRREKEFLLFLIREKDQKIELLLHQIAEVNAVLAAHRKVPVLRRF